MLLVTTFRAPEIYTIPQYFQDKIKLKLDEDVWGSECIAPRILDFYIEWSFEPRGRKPGTHFLRNCASSVAVWTL
jgi:hypothetical protein